MLLIIFFKILKNKADNQNLKKWTGSLSYLFTIFYNKIWLCFLCLDKYHKVFIENSCFSSKYLLKDNVVLDPNKNSKLQDIFSEENLQIN